jgi:hypothetical protein
LNIDRSFSVLSVGVTCRIVGQGSQDSSNRCVGGNGQPPLDTKADALKHFTSQTFGEIVRKLFDALNLEDGELAGIVVGPEPVELDEDELRTVGQLLVDGKVVGVGARGLAIQGGRASRESVPQTLSEAMTTRHAVEQSDRQRR